MGRFTESWSREKTAWCQQRALRVKFVLQPANSPDTNVNDLCFFRSLARHVQAHEREFRHDPRGLEEFCAFLQRDFHDFHSHETLERCWDVKTAVKRRAYSKRVERTITSSHTDSRTSKPFLHRQRATPKLKRIQWRAYWTTKASTQHSLLLFHVCVAKFSTPFFVRIVTREKKER